MGGEGRGRGGEGRGGERREREGKERTGEERRRGEAEGRGRGGEGEGMKVVSISHHLIHRALWTLHMCTCVEWCVVC